MTRFPDGLWNYIPERQNKVNVDVVRDNKSCSGYCGTFRNPYELAIECLVIPDRIKTMDEETTEQWLAKGSNQVRLAPLELLLWSE